MLNKKPIFIVGFQRGGTAILLNLLLSHPDVCKPRGETHEVFKGRRKLLPQEPIDVYLAKLWRYLPILVSQRRDLFSIDWWDLRPEVSYQVMDRIDEILFLDKLKALSPTENKYKTENTEYSFEEIKNSRLLCKNLNGLIFTTNLFNKMYPDSTFIALVRNGFALSEGHIRRGVSVSKIAQLYEKGCQKMIDDAMNMKNYHIFRYEDILNNPLDTLKRIYECADLSIDQVDKIRFVTKPVMTAEGQRSLHGMDSDQLIWYDLKNFASFLQVDVNEYQINRLSENQKQSILKHAYITMKYFSYI
jgi:hypothetical protein